MLTDYLRFEWRYFIRQPSFYVTALLFFFIAFFDTAVEGFSLGETGNYLKNGPYGIAQTQLFMGLFSLFLVVNFVGNTAIRNHAFMMEKIIYSKPLDPLQYQLGRFLGAFMVVAAVFLCAPIGHIIGALMWWVSSEKIGPIHLVDYVFVYVFFALPTLLVISAFFYAMASKFKSMMALYVTAVALFFLYLYSTKYASQPAYRTLASLLDPFGLNAWGEMTRYWTSSEKNTAPLTLSGVLLKNRIIWLVSGALIFTLFTHLFSMPVLKKFKQKTVDHKKERKLKPQLPTYNPNKRLTGSPSSLRQLLTRTGFECRQVIISAPFLILTVLTAIQLLSRLNNNFGDYGTHLLPVTQFMVSEIQNVTVIFIFIVLTYYSAEIIWRERELRLGDMIDTFPVPNWVYWTAKLAAIFSVLCLIYLSSIGITIAHQLSHGFRHLELAQYAIRLGYFTLLPWLMMAILAFFIQVLSPNKYVGMLVFVVYFIANITLNNLGYSHRMLHFSEAPKTTYSDMNGYAWSLATHSWYMLYWAGLSLALFALGYGVFHRGPMQSLRRRVALLTYNLGTTGKVIAAMGVGVFILSGAIIYYNTSLVQ